MFLTDVLFSSPRLRFSEAQKSAVLDWATKLGAANVPSLYAIKKCQNDIVKLVGVARQVAPGAEARGHLTHSLQDTTALYRYIPMLELC